MDQSNLSQFPSTPGKTTQDHNMMRLMRLVYQQGLVDGESGTKRNSVELPDEPWVKELFDPTGIVFEYPEK